MTESMRLVHEGCGSGHFTVGGADNDLRKALTIARHGATGSALEPYTPYLHEAQSFFFWVLWAPPIYTAHVARHDKIQIG